jgi:integrase
MPFLNRNLYWTWITRRDGRRVRVSTGTANMRTARAIEAMIAQLQDRAEFDLLDAVIERRRTLLDLYSEYRNDPALADARAALDELDLSPLVGQWYGTLVKRNVRSADDYVRQVRKLIPAGVPFPRSDFRRKTISEFLASLPVSGSTRNRYKAAFRQFGAWLVEREVLDHNPVVDVRGAKENPGRVVWYSREELKLLLDHLEQPYRAYEAIMAATGMETQAVLRLRRRDVDLVAGTIRAHGSKNEHRNRTVRITEAWAIPAIAEYVRDFLPDAPLFTFNARTARDHHKAACKAAKLALSTLHDHRHSYAVNALRRGVPLHIVSAQLGHSNTSLVQKRYGRFVPNEADYERWVAAEPSTQAVAGD